MIAGKALAYRNFAAQMRVPPDISGDRSVRPFTVLCTPEFCIAQERPYLE
jgi:hypothetical protein